MILFPILFCLTLVAYWALSRQLKTLFRKEWASDSQDTKTLLRGVLSQQLRILSSQNAVAQALVDYEVKYKNLRTSMMMLCFQKLGVVLPGLLIAVSLQWEAIFAALLLATMALAVAFKKPSKWIQIFLLAACFFGLYQGAFYQVYQMIYAGGGADFALTLADGRWPILLALTGLSFILTFLFRYEFWSVFLASLLFFAGAVPLTNALGIMWGEQLAWALYWYWGARKSSRVSGTIFLEYLILVIVGTTLYMGVALTLKAWGLLEISIFGSIIDKKLLFIFVWAGWEIFLTLGLLIWGHFRARSKLEESSELQPIQFPSRLLGVSWQGYKGWTPEQMLYRYQFMEAKLQRLQGHLKSLTGEERLKFPAGFLEKTQREVESLKRLLGSLRSPSV